MAAREEQNAENQETFRYANERLGMLITEAAVDHTLIPYLCECADDRCLGRIELTMAQYEDAHQLLHTYVILPGHPRVEHEATLENHGAFVVVQKDR